MQSLWKFLRIVMDLVILLAKTIVFLLTAFLVASLGYGLYLDPFHGFMTIGAMLLFVLISVGFIRLYELVKSKERNRQQ